MGAMNGFEGKVLLVTGAAGDIGGAVAHRLADGGAYVFLTDIAADKLKMRVSELETNGARVASAVCDVSDWRGTAAMVQRAAQWRGRIDLLFNNAGYQGMFEQTHAYPPEDFAKVVGINLVGAFHVLRATAEVMIGQKGGAVVNTASMASTVGPPNMAAYAASKGGVLSLTKTASKDLAPFNIRVNAISPGFVGPGFMWDRQVEQQAAVGSQYYATDPRTVADQMISRVPLRRYGSLSEISGVVDFLLSDEASYLTGVNVPISGGVL